MVQTVNGKVFSRCNQHRTQVFNHNLCTDFFILSAKSVVHGKEYVPKNTQEKSVPSQALTVSQQGLCHVYAARSNIWLYRGSIYTIY